MDQKLSLLPQSKKLITEGKAKHSELLGYL